VSDIRRVWIKSSTEKLEMILPVTPFITYKESMTINTQDLFGFGEIDSGASVKLDTWSCESFFPDYDNDYEFDVSRVKYSSDYYVEVFSRWMKEQQILEFQYYTDSKRINDYYCKITGFSHGEKNGSKNIYYTLDFKEYKELRLIDGQVVNSTATALSYGSDTYYVGEGDTLVTIAAKLYGDSSKWTYLMNRNSLKNPLDLTVGQALIL